MKASDLPPILRQFGLDPLLGGSASRQDIPITKQAARLRRQEKRQQELFEKRRLAANSLPTGEEAGQWSDIPVPKELARIRREEKRQQELFEKRRLAANSLATDEEAGQGPERLIGPRNPEHPGVNNDQGGRGVE